MPTQTVQLAAHAVEIGHYVRISRQWFKVRGHVYETNGGWYRIPVIDPKGNETHVTALNALIEVAVTRQIPSPFQPSTVRRSAAKARQKAYELLEQQRRMDALELVQLAEARSNTEAKKEAAK